MQSASATSEAPRRYSLDLQSNNRSVSSSTLATSASLNDEEKAIETGKEWNPEAQLNELLDSEVKDYHHQRTWAVGTMMWAHQVWWLIIAIANIPVYLYLAHTGSSEQLVNGTALAALINLTVTVLVRNELLLVFAYWAFAFIRIRRYYPHRMLMSIGGAHVGCAFATFGWIMAYTIELFKQTALDSHINRALVATATIIPVCLSIMIIFALRPIREAFHDAWEYTHRFVGWFVIADLVTHLGLKAATLPYAVDLFSTALPYLAIVCIISVFYIWFTVRKVPVKIEANKFVAVVKFPGQPTLPDGTFARISKNWWQWHAFSVALADQEKKEFALIIGKAGDWTTSLLTDSVGGGAPERLYIRGVNPPGFMYMIHSYKRVVVICTGAGIAPALPHIVGRTSNIYLIWIGREHRKTYGEEIWTAIQQNIPASQLLLHDTGVSGKPDIGPLIERCSKEHKSEAAFIVSNDSYTKHVSTICWPMGIRCYGATRDS